MPPIRSAFVLRAGLSSLLAIGLLVSCVTSTSRADFWYGWTELSVEWVTDASSAIALGEVLEVEKEGGFTFRVESVLKRASGFSLQANDRVEGTCLGRSTLYEDVNEKRFSPLSARFVYFEITEDWGDNEPQQTTKLPSPRTREPS